MVLLYSNPDIAGPPLRLEGKSIMSITKYENSESESFSKYPVYHNNLIKPWKDRETPSGESKPKVPPPEDVPKIRMSGTLSAPVNQEESCKKPRCYLFKLT